MKTRNKAVPAVYLLLEKDGKILLCRRYNTGYMDGMYDFPAGHVEAEELPLGALIREAKEEIGIEISRSDIRFLHFMYRVAHDETGERVDIFFTADTWKGKIKNMEPHKCDDMQWFTYDELPENMTPHVRRAVERIKKNIYFSEDI